MYYLSQRAEFFCFSVLPTSEGYEMATGYCTFHVQIVVTGRH